MDGRYGDSLLFLEARIKNDTCRLDNTIDSCSLERFLVFYCLVIRATVKIVLVLHGNSEKHVNG